MSNTETYQERMAKMEQAFATKDTELDIANKNAEYIVGQVIGPLGLAVRACQGGGFENVQESLSISIAKVVSELAAARKEIMRLMLDNLETAKQISGMSDEGIKAQVQIAEQAGEIEHLNQMRVHCPDCGADYLATGIEAGCPCKLKAEIEHLTEVLQKTAESHGLKPHHSKSPLGYLSSLIVELKARIEPLEKHVSRCPLTSVGYHDVSDLYEEPEPPLEPEQIDIGKE